MESKFILPLPLCSIQALNSLDTAHPHWGEPSALLSSLIQMLISSQNTLSNTPRNNVYLDICVSWLKLTHKINHHSFKQKKFWWRMEKPLTERSVKEWQSNVQKDEVHFFSLRKLWLYVYPFFIKIPFKYSSLLLPRWQLSEGNCVDLGSRHGNGITESFEITHGGIIGGMLVYLLSLSLVLWIFSLSL